MSQRPEPWEERAKCATERIDPDLFFIERSNPGDPPTKIQRLSIKAAKKVCNGVVDKQGVVLEEPCPVRLECLEKALRHREKFGIWGGTSNRERDIIRKKAAETL